VIGEVPSLAKAPTELVLSPMARGMADPGSREAPH
jgi:hypothetical protein